MLGDKAYSSRANRQRLAPGASARSSPNRPPKSITADAAAAEAGARSASMSKKYKRRNVIERSFNIVKNWRGLATRYDKLALTYRAAAVLAAICAWLRHLRDTP